MNKRQNILSIVVALSVAVMFTAAVSAPVLAHHATPARATALKTLRWYGLAGTAWPQDLDPAEITDSVSYNIADQVQGNLVTIQPNGTITPTPGHPASCWTRVRGRCEKEFTSLAQSVSEAKNHLSYTFTLRPNLRFADGHRLTASDVAYSMWRTLSKAAASPVALLYLGHVVGAHQDEAGKGSHLAGVHVINSRTVKIALDKRIAYFMKTLSYPTADVLDPAIVHGKKVGFASDYLNDTCINAGAGQFVFQCRNHRDDPNHSGFYKPGTTASITLVPNRNFWGPKPRIKIVMKTYPDSQHNYSAYKAGAVDMTSVPSADVASNRGHRDFLEFPTSVTDYMTPNEHPDSPFHNVHCRLAIAYGINRNFINNGVLHGTQRTTNQILPANIPPFSANFLKASYDNANRIPYYNRAKAAAQMSKCPQLKGYTLTIPYQHTSVDIDNEYAAIQAEIQSIPGFTGTVKLEPLSFNDWLTVVTAPKGLDSTGKGKVDLTENLWIEDYPDPQDYLDNLLRFGANDDIGYYDNPTYNDLINMANVNGNANNRAGEYLTAEKLALRQGAWIAVGNALGINLLNTRVHGLSGSAAYGELVPKNDLWANVSIH